MTLVELDSMSIEEAQQLSRATRDSLLDLTLADGRKLLGPQIARQAGLFCDYFEEDIVRLLKLRAIRIRCSGFIPIDERGEVPSQDSEAQFRVAFQNLARAVTKAGSSLDRVVNCIVFLRRMELWEKMNAIYREYLRCSPTRATIGTSGLNRGYEIEIVNVVAYKLAD
jgi:enamine deaminase RidA (YjgF/YER057c/UK114 family)